MDSRRVQPWSWGLAALYMVSHSRIDKPYSLFINSETAKTGAGTTASRLGQPDLAIAQSYEMRENADKIAGLDYKGPPLIADMDTGYGG